MAYTHVVCVNLNCANYNRVRYRNVWVLPSSNRDTELRNNRVRCNDCNSFNCVVVNRRHGYETSHGHQHAFSSSNQFGDTGPLPTPIDFPFPSGSIPVFIPNNTPASPVVGPRRLPPFMEPASSGRLPVFGIHAGRLTPEILQTQCSICNDEPDEGAGQKLMTLCRHVFHEQCLARWQAVMMLDLETRIRLNNNQCPNCRFELFARA